MISMQRMSVLAVGFLSTLSALVGCTQRNQYQAPPPPAVTVAKPFVKDVADFLEFTGTTRATDVVDIRARVNGYLKKIGYKDGAMVKQGDLLFEIEPEPFEAALASAKARLQKAEAVLSLAEAELKRTEPLVTQGALPEQERDIKVADRAKARADVAEAKAALRQAELNLSYTRIEAPISGRASRHMVDVGNLVQAEQTVLTRLESYQPIHAYFTISESEMVQLMDASRSQQKEKTTKPTQLRLGLAGEEGFPHIGQLDFAELGIEPGTGTQMRRGIFQNEDLGLVPGMFVRVRLQVGQPRERLLISERALSGDQRGAFVLVVNEAPPDPKAKNNDASSEKKFVVQQRSVKFGAQVEGRRVIEQGLTADDWVIVNGLQKARPGDAVTPERADVMPGGQEMPAHSDAKVAEATGTAKVEK